MLARRGLARGLNRLLIESESLFGDVGCEPWVSQNLRNGRTARLVFGKQTLDEVLAFIADVLPLFALELDVGRADFALQVLL